MRHEPSAFCKVATPAYHARSLLPWNWASTRDFAELLKAQAVNLEAGAFRFCVCTFSLYPTNLTHMAGTRFRNNPVLLKPDCKTITKPFATTTLGLEGMLVFLSIHMYDVTSIEKGVRVLVDVTYLCLFVFFVLCFLCGCGLVIILLFDMYLFCFALQLQLECDPLGFPRALHRKVGAGASGAHQLPDPENPWLYHAYLTFSLDIHQSLAQGKIVPGLGVRRRNRQSVEDHDSWELCGEDDIYSSEDSDALYYEESDDNC
jgi:hypothetical protein